MPLCGDSCGAPQSGAAGTGTNQAQPGRKALRQQRRKLRRLPWVPVPLADSGNSGGNIGGRWAAPDYLSAICPDLATQGVQLRHAIGPVKGTELREPSARLLGRQSPVSPLICHRYFPLCWPLSARGPSGPQTQGKLLLGEFKLFRSGI